MEVIAGLVILALWLFAIVACTQLGWKIRPVRAAMFFYINMENKLKEINDDLERQMAERRGL